MCCRLFPWIRKMNGSPSVEVLCTFCQRLVKKQPYELKRVIRPYCSRQCKGRHDSLTKVGPTHNTWKGGRTTHSGGYIRVNVGRKHPMADKAGWVLEHRLVMAQALGRMLDSSE